MNKINKIVAFSLIFGAISTASSADLYVWENESNEPIIIKEADIKTNKTKYEGYTIVEAPADYDVKTYSVKQIPSTAPVYTMDTIDPLKSYIVYKK